jgi:4-hydroxy-3-methylbut-2-enyl diphosphate reductase
VLCPMGIEARAVRRYAPWAEVVRVGAGRRAGRSLGEAGLRFSSPGRATAVAGLAGGLQQGLRAGHVVVANEVRSKNGTIPVPGARLALAVLRRRGISASLGPVWSSDHLVRSAERRQLAVDGLVAADLESSALALQRGTSPLCVLRVILDRPERDIPHPLLLADLPRALSQLGRAVSALRPWCEAVGVSRRVLLASPRSFCAGVERAIETVELAIERHGTPIYVRRQIVHNSHVVERLESLGARFVQELDEVPRGATVVLAAHGVSPAVRRQAAELGLTVVDATCPLVAKVHTEARRYAEAGRHVVLIGHADHEEVEGTLGEVPTMHLVEEPDDVESLDLPPTAPIAFLSQTTLAASDVRLVQERLRARFSDVIGPAERDICYATQNRQDALRRIAAEADLTLVVGSPNSSNTNRLVETALRAGSRARLIEDATALDLSWLAGARTIALTAGASAPDCLVAELVAELRALGPLEVVEEESKVERVRFPLPEEVR